MGECRSCGVAFDERFRFCPWCGTAQRLKIVEYFAALRLTAADEVEGLRVSRYLTRPGHVRFSVWKAGEVDAAVSISEREARRLGAFLASTDRRSHPTFGDRLKQSAHALTDTIRAPRSRVGSGV
jgi:hypothetical protein